MATKALNLKMQRPLTHNFVVLLQIFDNDQQSLFVEVFAKQKKTLFSEIKQRKKKQKKN